MSHRNRHRRTIRVMQGYVRDNRPFRNMTIGVTVETARDRFLMLELLRGGVIAERKTEKLVVKTQYPGYIGRLELDGPYDQMKPLCNFAALWEEASRHPASVTVVEEMQKRQNVISQRDLSPLPFVSTIEASKLVMIRLKIAAMLDAGFDRKAIEYGLVMSDASLEEAIRDAKKSGKVPLFSEPAPTPALATAS
ncbi:hypothetical protein KGO95_01015 [Patescibacteria group bacterium]|nr:hypothetical protein [Patescibacteria group bacterium]